MNGAELVRGLIKVLKNNDVLRMFLLDYDLNSHYRIVIASIAPDDSIEQYNW